ncbi:MAG: hypothetical protein K9N21_17395 [Deltaproteobacteria bacterium]|nr:hypothetical protein [Deltaproteobacteria bacterium]
MINQNGGASLEVLKWVLGVAVAAFVAGFGVVAVLDRRIDDRTAETTTQVKLLKDKVSKIQQQLADKDGLLELNRKVSILAGKQLRCTAYPVEEKVAQPKCGNGQYQLAAWCSGDCSGDDARVTICCDK